MKKKKKTQKNNASPDAEKFYQLKSFSPPQIKGGRRELQHTPVQTLHFLLCHPFLVFHDERNKKSRIKIQTKKKKKRSSLSYVRRGEAKMAVHAKTFESHPLREFYLKGSKTNGGRLGRSFKVKRGSETRLTTCGALFFFCFFNFFFF